MEKLKADLTRDEGIRLEYYKDTKGFYTIGVGHLLGNLPRMTDVTMDECDALLERDIRNATEIAESLVVQPYFWESDQEEVRRRALINMAFNLGNKLAEFKKFLSALNSGWYSDAAREMLDSLWAKQVGQRAVRLASMIETGKDPA